MYFRGREAFSEDLFVDVVAFNVNVLAFWVWDGGSAGGDDSSVVDVHGVRTERSRASMSCRRRRRQHMCWEAWKQRFMYTRLESEIRISLEGTRILDQHEWLGYSTAPPFFSSAAVPLRTKGTLLVGSILKRGQL